MTMEGSATPRHARARSAIAWLRRARAFLLGGWRPQQSDVVTAVVLFAVCGACAAVYVTTAGGARGYTEQYGPAVMLACGKGYFEPNLSDCPAL
ncbi:MAG: hypothetical protein FJY92_08660, partial [Candidatus Hydrogenedentes bacterium]|nr:hypothetical protein [Candidatus Hydrogenedentota bacterium]